MKKKIKPSQVLLIALSVILLLGASVVLVYHYRKTIFCESTLMIIVLIAIAILGLGGYLLLTKRK